MSLRKLFATFSLTLLLTFCTGSFASGYALHTIQAGESLGLIAERYGVSVDLLMSFNELTSALLQPGEVVKVPYTEATGGIAEVAPAPPPGFKTHTLLPGETLSNVAQRYGLTLKALIGANPDISSLDQLPAQLELLIPPSVGLVITLHPEEDLGDVLESYGVDPVEVVKANNLQSPGDLTSGSLLFLPGASPDSALERLAKVREAENRYLWPVHGRITSYFGRRNLGLGTSAFHRAIDISAPTGTPVVAARSGTVSFVGWSDQGYGNLIKISHGGGAETWYAHNSQMNVSVGQYVNQSETIGLVGSTGLSTGPHLHFEVHENGEALDPLGFLP